MKKSGKHFTVLLIAVTVIAIGFLGHQLWALLRRESASSDRQAADPGYESVSNVSAGDEQDIVSDTLRPLVWFDGKANAYELLDWDDFEDVNAAGMSFFVLKGSDAARQVFQAYADRLSEEDYLQEISRQQYENDFGEYDQEACYTYTGAESVGTVTSMYSLTRCSLMVSLTLLQDGGVINLAWGEGFPMDTAPYDTDIERLDYGTDAEDAEESGPSGDDEAVGDVVSDDTETVNSITSGDGVLPDAHAFFNGELIHSEESITNGTKAVFSVKQEYAAAAYEYVELLKSDRFGLSLARTITDEHSGSDLTTEYVFDYTGSREVEQVSLYSDGGYIYGAVIIRVNDWPKWGWCEMSIRFSDGLTVADTGDRCSITGLVDDTENGISGPMGGGYASGGSSGSDIDWDDDDDEGTRLRIPCPKCHGDGEVECSQCDGDKGKWVYDSVPNYSGHSSTTARTWEPCFKCHGTGKVTCPKCDGERRIYA